MVLLANNGYAARLAGGALGRGVVAVTPVFTRAGLTAPLTPDARSLLGSDPSWGLLPAHRLGTTLRLTEDHRLLVRSVYDGRLPPGPRACWQAARAPSTDAARPLRPKAPHISRTTGAGRRALPITARPFSAAWSMASMRRRGATGAAW